MSHCSMIVCSGKCGYLINGLQLLLVKGELLKGRDDPLIVLRSLADQLPGDMRHGDTRSKGDLQTKKKTIK